MLKDATYLEFMWKRKIYEKLINNKSEGDLGEMRNWLASSYKGSGIQWKDAAIKKENWNEKKRKVFNIIKWEK